MVEEKGNNKGLLIALGIGAFVGLVIFFIAKFSKKPKKMDNKNESISQQSGVKVDVKPEAYAENLKGAAKANADNFIKRMKLAGITNQYTQAAIMAIISKESGFIPKSENLNYTSAQIQKIFSLKKEEADKLVGKPEALANKVYGNRGGNSSTEGFKYRGRGYNQITFKDTYKRIGEAIGKDLVGNPDLLNDPTVAADAAIRFFKNGIEQGRKLNKLAQYNASDINDFKDVKNALMAIYNINAGWGSSKKKIEADVTGGLAKAKARVDSLYNYVKTV